MVPSEKKPSLQEILRRRQREEFVGREEQLIFFRRNLRWEIDDPRRRFVINISGQGGVGKTWLLRRFGKIAEEFAAVTAYTDETEDDVPSVMGRIAEQFDAQGYPLKAFAERYRVYRQRRQEIEADPDAPQGFPAFLGRTLAKGGLRLARRVPIGGVAADLVDEEIFASLAGDFASYVARKIGNKDEVRLVLEPVEVLTPLFLADLQKVAKRHPLALFFDTYERTGGFLDPWLRDLLEGRHGDVPVNIVLVITGRDELDRNHWAPYEGLLARLPLEPFTKEEAHDYLSRKGITDERVVEVILGLSGRLPLLVATLAAESPDDPAKVGDPSGEAVERFLKWVEDPEQRQVALDAALPRRLNRDVLAVLVGEEEANALFAWLRGMPFVERRGDCWAYHDVVRVQMLRCKQQESPQGWADLHGRLAAYYEGLRDGLGLEEEAGRKDETWRGYALETLYHHLCQAPQKHLPNALTGFLVAVEQSRAFSSRWAETVHQAGTDTCVAVVQYSGQRMVESIDDFYYGRSYDSAVTLLNLVEEQLSEDSPQRVIPLAKRASFYGLLGQHERALTDYGRVINLQPEDAKWYGERALVLRQMKRYDEALANYAQAIELEPKTAKWLSERASLLRDIERCEEALADYSRAIELEPENAWNFAWRASLLRDMRHYNEALADLNRAVELEPEEHFRFGHRAELLEGLGRYEEAVADYTRAIELKGEKTKQIESPPEFKPGDRVIYLGGRDYELRRGHIYHLLGRYKEALADFNHAIQLDPDAAWAIAPRGVTYLEMGCYGEALADLDRAVELDSGYTLAIAGRGTTYMEMRRYEEALAEFDKVIELDPDCTWAIANRGVTYLRMGCYEEALADLRRAHELETDNAQIVANLGATCLQMEHYEEALAHFSRAIELDSNYAWVIAHRGVTYRQIERYNEALADFDRAIELKPDLAWAIVSRGETYRQMKRYEEALADFNRAIELDPDYAWAIASRGLTYLQMERYEEALADFNRVIELDPDLAEAIASRGETYRQMERYEEALADFNRAIELKPDKDWYLYNRALTYQSLDQADKAQADLRVAIQHALEAYEKEPQDWQNTFNLALYHLALGEPEEAERLYREALSGWAPLHGIREASRDLEDFLILFPGHLQAQAMRDLLQEYLQGDSREEVA